MELKDVIAGTTPQPQAQNLVNPIRITEKARPAGYYKSIFLDGLSVGSALFFGYAFVSYLTSGFSAWYVVLAALVFSTLSVLQVFLARKIGRRVFILVAEVAALLIFFLGYDDWQVLFFAASATLLFLLWGYWQGREEVKNSMEIVFFRTSRHVLGKVITALLLFMIVVYAPRAEGQGIFVSQNTFKTFFDWSSGFVNNFYPWVPFSGTFSDFSKSLAKAQLQDNPSFRSLSLPAQDAAVAQASEQVAASVQRVTGVAPAPNDRLSDVTYRYVVAMLADWKHKFQDRFVLAWGIVLFLILRSIGIVFVWITQFFALIVYEILLAAGFMHIEETTQTKEIVQY